MALKPVGGKYDGVWVNNLKNGDKSYYINYRDENNKPVKQLVGKNTLLNNFTAKDAYAKLIEMKYKLQNNEEIIIEHGRVSKIKLNDLWDKFFENNSLRVMDQQNYNKHIKPVFGNKDIKSLKSLHFEKFKQDLFAKKLEPQTVKHQLTLIRTIFNYAIKNGLVKNFTNPISGGKVKMPEIDNKRQGYLTKDQAKELLRILKATHTLTYHLTVLLLFTGVRFSEITGASAQKNKTGKDRYLKWADVNFNNNTIYFKKTKKGNDRHIAMGDTLLETIEYLYSHKVNDAVITNSTGGIVLKMPRYFMEAVEVIIPGNRNKDLKHKITVHSLRHTHASWLAESGLDILQIKEQLGHKNIEMTMRYAHLIPNKRHEATRALFL